MSKFEVIQDTGYGMIPRRIMRDEDISIQAKAIYSYLASFAGNTGRSFPSTSLMAKELDISNNTLFKYLKELKDKEIITIKKERAPEGTFEKNVYYLHNKIGENVPSIKSSYMAKSYMANPYMANKDTNSNNLNSNNSNSSKYVCRPEEDTNLKEIASLYESNVGSINSIIAEQLLDISDSIEPELFKEAIKIAADKGKCNFGYIKGIIRQWISNNILTYQDLEAYRVERRNRDAADRYSDDKKFGGHEEQDTTTYDLSEFY